MERKTNLGASEQIESGQNVMSSLRSTPFYDSSIGRVSLKLFTQQLKKWSSVSSIFRANASSDLIENKKAKCVAKAK